MLTLATRLGDITLEEILLIGVPALLGTLAIFLLWYAAVKHRRDVENSAHPILVENAKVIDKHQGAPNTLAFEAWVLFETESGKRVRLFANPNDIYLVGDEGRLRWQGTRLIAFERGRMVKENAGKPEYIPAWKRIQMEESNRVNAEDGNA